MAIWQFWIIFVPRKNLIDRFGEIRKKVDEEVLWKEDLESGVDLPNNYEDILSCLGEMERLKWTPECYNWGD